MTIKHIKRLFEDLENSTDITILDTNDSTEKKIKSIQVVQSVVIGEEEDYESYKVVINIK